MTSVAYIRVYVHHFNSVKGIEHLEKAIIFSPSNCYKPVRLSVLYWTQKKIFWRMLVNKQLLVAIDFHSMEKILQSQWLPVWLHTFFQKPSLVLNRRKKYIQFWNNIKESKYIFFLPELPTIITLSLIKALLMTGTLLKCLLWDGEQMSRRVYMEFYIAVLQLHEAASDLHLLPEGRQELLLE